MLSKSSLDGMKTGIITIPSAPSEPALPQGLQRSRVKALNDKDVRRREKPTSSCIGVLYWMQRSVRVEMNHALTYAVAWANHLKLPLITVFTLTENYPEANERSFSFLLEGLSEVSKVLNQKGIRHIVRRARDVSVPVAVLQTCSEVCCPVLIVDRGYDTLSRSWREEVSRAAPCRVIQVESDVVVPVETASHTGLPSAAALRHRQAPLLPTYLVPLAELPAMEVSAAGLELPTSLTQELMDITDPAAALEILSGIDRSVKAVRGKQGGPSQAKLLLARFLRDRLTGYHNHRKEAHRRQQSFLSPYLHYGHISPVYIALKVRQHTSSSPDDRRRFLDELITWREMAINFVYYTEGYATYEGAVPTWAKDSLHEHVCDARPALYSLEELEHGRTRDVYWNAAQEEMVHTGMMFNYLRMYWCKQIIMWTATPQEAYERARYLNDKYFLDGRDPNGWMGIAWCFGRFDEQYPAQNVMGRVRVMSSRGLKSGQDMELYIAQVKDLVKKVKAQSPSVLTIEEYTYARLPSSDLRSFLSATPPGRGGGGSGGETSSEGKKRKSFTPDEVRGGSADAQSIRGRGLITSFFKKSPG